MTSFGFDVSSTKPQAAFDPLPPGWYAMRVTKADIVVGQKAGAGQMLKVEFEIQEHEHPEYAGRRVFANFCHHHDNKQTRDIARAQIAAICQSVGKPTASAIDEILGGELRVKLSVQPAKDGYDARNEVKGFKPMGPMGVEGATSMEAPATKAQATQTNQATQKAAPWKR